MKRRKGFFITLEGTDGTGKTTHAQLLKTWLEKKGLKVVLTREPGGGALSEKIRGILLDPKIKMTNLTELFLYEAARIEHVSEIVRPALDKNAVVVCDRYTDATFAYQGFARKLNLEWIATLNSIATMGITPDLTLLLDLPVYIGLKKAQKRSKSKNGDRLEREGLDFQKQVKKGYQWLAKTVPERIKVVTVADDPLDTQEQIRLIVGKFLK